MSLNFPHKPEVRLGNPPLAEVVCQVRFPPILRIAKDEPSEFQEFVRERFPELEVEQGFLVRVPGIGSGGIPAAEAQAKIYRFRDLGGHSHIALALDFLALSTSQYSHWSNFANDLRLAHDAAQEVYKVGYATRIGLRYINRLTLSNTNRSTMAEVFDLFRPELTTQLRSEAWSDPINMLCQLVLPDGDARLMLRTGYNIEDNQPFLLLDLDYFQEGKLNLDDLIERCNGYHEIIYDAFRWCLKDDGLKSFNPIS
jgi:uncharacterized protein (TIGR04255 family)